MFGEPLLGTLAPGAPADVAVLDYEAPAPLDGRNVAGHWVLRGSLTMADLRDRHEALNARCQVEAYPMRASWFRYVDETFGRKATLEVMYSGREMTPKVVEAALGAPLVEVDAGWRAWVTARYAAHASADAEAEAYRARIGFYIPCEG